MNTSLKSVQGDYSQDDSESIYSSTRSNVEAELIKSRENEVQMEVTVDLIRSCAQAQVDLKTVTANHESDVKSIQGVSVAMYATLAMDAKDADHQSDQAIIGRASFKLVETLWSKATHADSYLKNLICYPGTIERLQNTYIKDLNMDLKKMETDLGGSSEVIKPDNDADDRMLNHGVDAIELKYHLKYLKSEFIIDYPKSITAEDIAAKSKHELKFMIEHDLKEFKPAFKKSAFHEEMKREVFLFTEEDTDTRMAQQLAYRKAIARNLRCNDVRVVYDVKKAEYTQLLAVVNNANALMQAICAKVNDFLSHLDQFHNKTLAVNIVREHCV